MCLAAISRGLRGVLRRSEPLEGIYGRFPSVDPVAFRARVPYLGKVYLEKKPLEPKLHYTALNQLKNHTAHKESRAGIQVSGFIVIQR